MLREEVEREAELFLDSERGVGNSDGDGDGDGDLDGGASLFPSQPSPLSPTLSSSSTSLLPSRSRSQGIAVVEMVMSRESLGRFAAPVMSQGWGGGWASAAAASPAVIPPSSLLRISRDMRDKDTGSGSSSTMSSGLSRAGEGEEIGEEGGDG